MDVGQVSEHTWFFKTKHTYIYMIESWDKGLLCFNEILINATFDQITSQLVMMEKGLSEVPLCMCDSKFSEKKGYQCVYPDYHIHNDVMCVQAVERSKNTITKFV